MFIVHTVGFENEGLKIEMPSFITSSQNPQTDTYESMEYPPTTR